MPDPTESTLRFTDDTDLFDEAKDRGLVAAGPWQEGEPTEEGRYLCEYETQGKAMRKVFVFDYRFYPESDKWTWAKQGLDVTILRYAPIHT